MTLPNLRILSMLILVCLTTACSSSARFQVSQAALAGDPVAMWQDGQEAVRLGESQVTRGEERIQDGERLIDDGETLVGNGNNLINVSRENYRLAVRDFGSADSPEELRTEVGELRDILRVWEEGLDLIARGNRRIEDGNEQIEEGRSVVFEGRNLIATGRNMMQSSEQMRQDEAAQSLEQESEVPEATAPEVTIPPGNPATSSTPPTRSPTANPSVQ
ncbi:MAG: hypothetical protein R3F41_02180 [Gammaproteobacteria bacterium]|nr:hypothetical protein [Pseudomonadales bacterium]